MIVSGSSIERGGDMSKKEATEEDEERKLLVLFAEDVRAFTVPEVERERTRLAQLLEAKRQSLAATHDLLDQYVVKLIHRCPNFLDGPVGFAWVEERYKLLLQRVRTFPDVSKRYWNIMMPEVRKSFVPRGPRQSPENRQRDIEQTMAVHIAMNEGMGKTEAVTEFIRTNLRDNMEIDQNEVFRALKRLEQQVAGTYQNLLHSPNTERNQKNTAAFFAMLTRESNPETATKVLSQKEKALMGTFSKWFEKPARNDTRARKINPKGMKRKK
jgi:hypothetical protein